MKSILSNSDKYHIAEFIYSYATDVLIKSDAEKVIKVLNEHFTMEDIKMDASVISNLIRKYIDEQSINSIMVDYYAGRLN